VTPRLSVRGLCASYEGCVTLSDVDVHVMPGERVALLGANGAGKTTLLYHLNALLVADQGDIRLDGERLPSAAAALSRWRQAVGLLFQDPDDQLFGPTVLDDVAIGPHNAGATPDEARARALVILRHLGLERLRGQAVNALSLGQRRAVALAGVLVMHPSLLLLDEPTQGLDADIEEALLATVEEATSRGAGVLMATHDVDLACRWADRVIVLHSGRVLCDGDPEDVLTEPTLMTAALRRPWVLEVARCLRQRHLLPMSTPLPRSADALIEALVGAPADLRGVAMGRR